MILKTMQTVEVEVPIKAHVIGANASEKKIMPLNGLLGCVFIPDSKHEWALPLDIDEVKTL